LRERERKRREKVERRKWGYAFVVADDEGKAKQVPSAYYLSFLLLLLLLQTPNQTEPNLPPNPNLRGCVFFKELTRLHVVT